MTCTRRALLFTSAMTLIALSVPSLASAKPSAVARRLMKHKKSERYEVQTTHSSIKAGAARISVRAPVREVRKVVLDFRHYEKFIRHFDKSRVIGRSGRNTDVYLRVPILKGAAKIWAVVRFSPPRKVHGGEIVEGHMIKGNIKRLDAWWRIKRIDEHHTQLDLELLIVPRMPLPGSLVTGETAYAADNAVTGSRNRAETLEAKRHANRAGGLTDRALSR